MAIIDADMKRHIEEIATEAARQVRCWWWPWGKTANALQRIETKMVTKEDLTKLDKRIAGQFSKVAEAMLSDDPQSRLKILQDMLPK